jgi:mannose-6-phosphate isomerase-like protein (cupin superfamily)
MKNVRNWHLRLNQSLIKLFRPKQIQEKMKIVKSKDFTAEKAWGAVDIANMNGVTTRLHWTDKPYKWHTNDGEEVFAVLDGTVEMRYRENGIEKRIQLETGDVFFAEIGCQHVAHPIGEARILVVEKEGSV